jgi:hypothetical protein
MKKFALVFLAAPLALAACGSSSPRAISGGPHKFDPVAYVKQSAQKTAALPSEHMTMTGRMDVGPMQMGVSGSGDYSNTTHQGSFTVNASVMGQNIKMTEVLDGTTIYMSSPLMTQDLPAGKTWVKIDLAAAAKANGGVDISSLMSRSPTQALQQLEAAGTVKKIGTETIDGTATTHYWVEHLDVTKLPQGAKLAALGQITYGPIDVWIGNADSYVYRETMSFAVKASGQRTALTMRSDFSKFGEKVDVTVPPADETTDASNLPGFGG